MTNKQTNKNKQTQIVHNQNKPSNKGEKRHGQKQNKKANSREKSKGDTQREEIIKQKDTHTITNMQNGGQTNQANKPNKQKQTNKQQQQRNKQANKLTTTMTIQ